MFCQDIYTTGASRWDKSFGKFDNWPKRALHSILFVFSLFLRVRNFCYATRFLNGFTDMVILHYLAVDTFPSSEIV